MVGKEAASRQGVVGQFGNAFRNFGALGFGFRVGRSVCVVAVFLGGEGFGRWFDAVEVLLMRRGDAREQTRPGTCLAVRWAVPMVCTARETWTVEEAVRSSAHA